MKTKPHRINKRIMAVIISFAIVIGVIAAPQMGIQTYAMHEWDFKIDKLYYKILNDGVSVSVSDGTNYRFENVKIPSKVDYNGKTYTVTEVGEYCFNRNESIVSVAIPNSVKVIRNNAFNEAKNLEKVSIPDSVNTLEWDSFRECSSLTSITIPDSVTEIEYGAFQGCKNLESVVLPNSIKTIPEHLFSDCNSLTMITIPDSVLEIQECVISDCNSITSIFVPSSVKNVNIYAFAGCKSLSSLYIPYNINYGLPSYKKYLKYYCPFVVNSDHGKVNLSVADTPNELLEKNGLLVDDAVVVNVVPDSGYNVSSIEVLNDEGKAVGLSSDNMFFTKKTSYTINVTFEALDSGQSGNNSSGAGTSGGNGGSSGNSSNNGTGSATGTSSGASSNNGSGSAAAGNSSNGVAYSSEWVNGKWYNTDGSQTYEPTMSWKSNSVGWWLEDTSGWYPVSQWQKVDGCWYYFNADGYMASSEWRDGYYLSGSGALDYEPTASWYKDSKGWYFMDTSGWYPYGQWQKINGSWYYFDGDGYMVTSRYIDGYWIGADGVCN